MAYLAMFVFRPSCLFVVCTPQFMLERDTPAWHHGCVFVVDGEHFLGNILLNVRLTVWVVRPFSSNGKVSGSVINVQLFCH